MPYRRTENVVRRLAARKDAIVAAAREVLSEGGMAAIQIAPVAARAEIAAGTMYRYFPAKSELLGAIVQDVSTRELAAMRRAADAAPGPLTALAAAIATFTARARKNRRLTYALTAEPVDPEVDALRLGFRKSIADELAVRIAAAVAGGHVPVQEAGHAAVALTGGLLEGAIGPLAPAAEGDSGLERAAVQALTLFALRALGVSDARARGVVVQTPISWDDDSAPAPS